MSLESGHHEVQVYGAESTFKRPLDFLRAMFADIAASRTLGFTLAVRDLKAQYRQSLLGILWAFGPPIFMTVMLTVAKQNNFVSPPETQLPYPAFVLISMSLWQVFTAALNGPLSALQANKGILTRVRFPRESVIIADLVKLAFTISIQMVLIIATFIWYRIPPSPGMLLAPVALLVLIALGTTFGLFLAPIGTLYRDIANSLPVIIGVWFTITPVAYPYRHYNGLFATVVTWNPVTPVLTTVRELATGEALTLLPNFLIVAAVTIPMFLLGLAVLRASIPLLIERWSA
jgi:lipopolysaccharide transport system permease protein